MKYNELKKRLVIEGGGLLAAIAVLAGGVYYLGMVGDDFTKGARDMQGQVNGITGETEALHLKFAKVRQNVSFYQEAMKLQSENRLAINREMVRDKFSQFKDDYYLNNIRLSMSPVIESKDPTLKRKTNAMEYSDVTVDFDALSDEYIYSMMNVMQQELSGSMRITHLSLARVVDALPEDGLRTVSQTGNFPLTRGQIKFQWLGIHPVETNKTANASPEETP